MPAHIIISREEQIACPKCAHSFAISDGLSRQTIDRHAEEFEAALARRARESEARIAAEAKRQVERARQEAAALASEKAETELRSLRETLASKQGLVDGFRASELELRRQVNALEEHGRNQEVAFQRRLDEERRAIEERAHSSVAQEFQRREAQLKAVIESSQREVADLKRKLEQGSQQTQGEALELSLESSLRAAFPFDEIAPVPKGVNGADLLQRVRTPNGQVCGTIVWETKETKSWQAAWIGKLKDDQQAVAAEVAVLVTAAMPKDTREPFIRESDVWVARMDAARPLAEALRTTLLELHKLRQANTGRNEKMELLYDFIHSPRFAQRVQLVYETFDAMRAELDAEQKAIMKIWKKREAQIARVTTGLIGVVGELQGLADDGLPSLQRIAALPGMDCVDFGSTDLSR